MSNLGPVTLFSLDQLLSIVPKPVRYLFEQAGDESISYCDGPCHLEVRLPHNLHVMLVRHYLAEFVESMKDNTSIKGLVIDNGEAPAITIHFITECPCVEESDPTIAARSKVEVLMAETPAIYFHRNKQGFISCNAPEKIGLISCKGQMPHESEWGHPFVQLFNEARTAKQGQFKLRVGSVDRVFEISSPRTEEEQLTIFKPIDALEWSYRDIPQSKG